VAGGRRRKRERAPHERRLRRPKVKAIEPLTRGSLLSLLSNKGSMLH
jgi:hypothetical protein